MWPYSWWVVLLKPEFAKCLDLRYYFGHHKFALGIVWTKNSKFAKIPVLITDLVSSCIPHIMPIIRFFENPLPGIPHTSASARNPTVKQLSASEGDLLGSVASGGNENSVGCWICLLFTLKVEQYVTGSYQNALCVKDCPYLHVYVTSAYHVCVPSAFMYVWSYVVQVFPFWYLFVYPLFSPPILFEELRGT